MESVSTHPPRCSQTSPLERGGELDSVFLPPLVQFGFVLVPCFTKSIVVSIQLFSPFVELSECFLIPSLHPIRKFSTGSRTRLITNIEIRLPFLIQPRQNVHLIGQSLQLALSLLFLVDMISCTV